MTIQVCILTSVHPVFDPRIFHKQARALKNAGFNVTLFAQHTRNETIEGITIIALPRPQNRFRRVMATIGVFHRTKKMKAQVYHFHDPELLPAGLFLKLTTGARVFYDVHEDYAASLRNAYYLPGYLRPVFAWAVGWVERFIAPRLDGVISATDDIGRKFANHPHFIVIHNYPVISRFPERLVPTNQDYFQAVYAGVITPERGLAQVIKALEIARSQDVIRLSLYGKSVPPQFEDELKSMPGAVWVDFKGQLPPEEAWCALVAGDVGVVCFQPGGNHDRSMPNKLFEYMAAGLPVVASSFPLWKEIVEGNRCGITVDPLDPKEIANALLWLKNHPNEAREMGRNGRLAALTKYSWESEKDRLVDFYNVAITTGPGQVKPE
jgi:glycosyltransferase involved in cell wall biosynthesis